MITSRLIVGCLVGTIIMGAGSGCTNGSETKEPVKEKPVMQAKPKLFQLLKQPETGIGFNNEVQESDAVNFYKYQYLYNGAGVAIGDVDNDGLPDIYFTGNLVPDRLYRNKGNLQFEDITAKAGIRAQQGWKTGVCMADVNDDGWMDIYVCRSGWQTDPEVLRNLLYINNGDGTFKESAAEYGLNDPGHSVQAAFFDYDKDGDLDMYVTNHPIQFTQKLDTRLQNMANPPEPVRDKLYQNDGHHHFTDVSKKAGILNYGHGLGLCISDLNNDNWPDIYIANDFQSHDYYYVNNGDGTFTDRVKESFKHMSYFAMGCDIADMNDDGLLDVMEVEMLAEDNKRQKTNMATMNTEIFWTLVDLGFHYQYMRNALHLNNGQPPGAPKGGSFSDVAWMTGLSHTDWSWAPLWGDFDNNGTKDLVVTNGYLRDTQDKDYVKKSNELGQQHGGHLAFSQVAPLMNTTRLANYAFQNHGQLQFTDVSDDWGFNFPGFSHGMGYADLDLDGDLDLVVNNTNDLAHVYRNSSVEQGRDKVVRVRFEGPEGNRLGLGTKLTLETDKGKQYQEFQMVRGFQSSVEPVVHFALAAGDKAKALMVQWPDGKKQEITALGGEKVLTVAYQDALLEKGDIPAKQYLFTEARQQGGAKFAHKEVIYDDYAKEILLPHKQSQMGPKLAVADVNGDGREDFYIGGASRQSGALFLQSANGDFKNQSGPWAQDAFSEDAAAHFFDADGDQDMDLYVVSGSNEWPEGSPQYQDRLYLNDGKGTFTKSAQALPQMFVSGGCVASGDLDGDGDLDLFVGGRNVPGKYPFAPRSFVLRNDQGKFTDVTEDVAPDLVQPGLVNSAVWSDYDGDGQQDLIIAGEWMPVSVFHNNGGKLENRTTASGLDSSTGWWNKIVAQDFDGDGDPDYVIGNLGTNYKYLASPEAPFHIYCHDFDKNGTFDIVLSYYNQGDYYPVRGRQCTSEQMPYIKNKFPTYESFGMANMEQVYGDQLKEALHYAVRNFASSYLENKGNGQFELRPLPVEVQIAPVNGMAAHDFNGDGHPDVLAAGNLYVSEVETGRADGGTGLLLLGDGKGRFKVVPSHQSGFFANSDVKDVALVKSGDSNPVVCVANNDGPLQVFRVTGKLEGMVMVDGNER